MPMVESQMSAPQATCKGLGGSVGCTGCGDCVANPYMAGQLAPPMAGQFNDPRTRVDRGQVEAEQSAWNKGILAGLFAKKTTSGRSKPTVLAMATPITAKPLILSGRRLQTIPWIRIRVKIASPSRRVSVFSPPFSPRRALVSNPTRVIPYRPNRMQCLPRACPTRECAGISPGNVLPEFDAGSA